MKAKQLKEILAQCDDDDVIIIASDPEGNSFHQLGELSVGVYAWDDEEEEIGIRKLTLELEKDGYSEEDVMKNGIFCTVLWP